MISLQKLGCVNDFGTVFCVPSWLVEWCCCKVDSDRMDLRNMGMHAAFSAGLPEDEVVCHVVTLDALVGWALIKRSIPLRNVRVAGVMP